MKKSSIAVSVVVALAIAYPGAAWITGKQLEKKLSNPNSKDAVFANLKVTNQKYKRGIFTSTQESTIELNYGNLAAKPAPQALQDTANGAVATDELDPNAAAGKALSIQVINKITHGPIPGMLGFGAGKIETEFVLDAKTVEELKKVFGDKKFLEIRTLLNYNGSGSVHISSPAISTTQNNQRDKLDWKGVQFHVAFDPNYRKIQFDLNAPGLDAQIANGTSEAHVGEIKMRGNVDRIYPDGMIYLGTTEASVKEMSFSNSQAKSSGFAFKDLRLESLTTNKNDLIDSSLKFGIGNIEVNQSDIGSFHYDYALRNLHGPSVNKLSQEFYAIDQTNLDEEKLEAMKKNFVEYGKEILKHNPVLALERLSLETKKGEFKTSGELRFADVTPEDFENVVLLLGKLEAKADVKLSDQLVQEIVSITQTETSAREAMLGVYEAQIKNWEGLGYLKHAGDAWTSQLLWKAGKLSINGVPYGPTGPADPYGISGSQMPVTPRP